MGFPAEKCIFLQKNAISYRKLHFPAEKCKFLQKNAVFGRKPQEIAGGLQGSRIKNASQLSQELILFFLYRRPSIWEAHVIRRFSQETAAKKQEPAENRRLAFVTLGLSLVEEKHSELSRMRQTFAMGHSTTVSSFHLTYERTTNIWGQNYYLVPNLYSRRIIFRNSRCFLCTQERF